VKDNDDNALLTEPEDYSLIWKSPEGKTSNSVFSIWEPIPQANFVSLGSICYQGDTKPPTNLIRCVHKSCVVEVNEEKSAVLWTKNIEQSSGYGLHIWSLQAQRKTVHGNLFTATKQPFLQTLMPKSRRAEKHYQLVVKGVKYVPLPSRVSHLALLSSQLATCLDPRTSEPSYSDLTIAVGDKTIHAHSLLVCGQSNIKGNLVAEGKFDYSTVHTMIQYFHTGRVNVNQKTVYPLISCADFYGAKQLRDSCFDYILCSIDKDTVCSLISKGHRQEFDFDAKILLEKCFSYASSHFYQVCKSDDFLNIDQESIEILAKNDKLSIDELELFLAVVRWGEHHCREQDAQAKLLEPIMQHIRFPIISGPNLLKHVKSTKVVPKHLYIEAIEYHLFPDLLKNTSAKKFEERYQLFHGGSLLTSVMSMQLNEWIGNPMQEWETIYVATRDGFQGSNFHKKCDGQGPTVTVIKSSNGNIFGGYTKCKWASNNNYSYDAASFIFSFVNSLKRPLKFEHSGPNMNSIYNSAGYCPTFGSGHDIHLCSNCNTSNGSYSNLGYSFPFTDCPGFSYNGESAKNLLAGSYNFTVSQIEVFIMK